MRNCIGLLVAAGIVVTMGCKDFKVGGAGAWGTTPAQGYSGVNVYNCTSDTIGVFWSHGNLPNWDEAEGATLSPASNCGAGLYISFENGKQYHVRAVRNHANCAANSGTNEIEPTDCSPFSSDRPYLGDSNKSDTTWEVN